MSDAKNNPKASKEQAPKLDEDKRKADLELKRLAEEEASRIADTEAKAAISLDREAGVARTIHKDEQKDSKFNDDLPKRAEVKRSHADESRRRTGRLTVAQALSGNADRQRSLASVKRKRAKEKRQSGPATTAQKLFREVIVPDSITVAELANRMTEKPHYVIRALMKMGVMSAAGDQVDHDVAELIVEEFCHKLKRVSASDVELDLSWVEDIDTDLLPRAPVVTVM